MASRIEGDVARIEAALNTPTLKLLDRKSASIALPLFANAFPEDAQQVSVEQFHTVVDALLDELRAGGYDVAKDCTGKTLAMQWVRERWLYRDPGQSEETYQLTGDAKQALEYVTRATRTQLNVSLSRIETMRRVISEAALAANPDREEHKRRLAEEIARLQGEYERLDSGGEMPQVTESELTEQFSNVLRELDGLPSDFRRVEEAVRDMHRAIAKKFREEERPIGEVVDDYLEQSAMLLSSTPEGRAFEGATELLRNRDWLMSLRDDLERILAHPLAGMLLPDETRQLRTAVNVIRRGRDDVLEQRHRASATLREYIENYDHVRNRELDVALKGIDREMRMWMQSARARDRVDVEIIPPALDIAALRFRTFDPDSERAPAPLEDVSSQAPAALSLDEIRKQGGPSLDQLGEHIEAKLSTGDLESVATVFNDLPVDLRRPVEVLGLLHLFTRIGAEIDPALREEVLAVRPDGSTRRFHMPSTAIQTTTDVSDEGAHS
ncbi:hypothetical protein AUR04nite_10530 [Glutamicibacter uratoxydans]|uniref:DUF3375 domain-containing protein n=1 Tax=Glutamicibacter uratoxydans TaxID=43667 RepID=A0A4Y4DSP3_GLUUR|nr:DUF3375 family protein [Glutamicibacter uratoxydans]GED05521.1 hypothetical protein AUR04nite_10530 [Glutamicibacter uratoxydans]